MAGPVSPTRSRRIAACVAGVNVQGPALAVLWLARASLNCDPDGRTTYGPGRFADEIRSSYDACAAAVEWLISRSLVIHDTTPDGVECWRLIHFDFNAADPIRTIAGYGPNSGSPADGLPPAYGRSVDQVVDINPGGDYQPPAWVDVAPTILQPATTPEENTTHA